MTDRHLVHHAAGVRPLPSGSLDDVRDALRVVAPELADEPIELAPRVENDPPSPYRRGTARVGTRWLAKFAWSDDAAVGIARELAILAALPELAPGVPSPRVAHASLDPLLFVTRFVDGPPLGHGPEGSEPALAAQLAVVLASLHDPGVRAGLDRAGVAFGAPQPQSTTDDLRARFAGPVVGGDRATATLDLCAWVDEVLADDVGAVVVHGDLHGFNVVVSADRTDLLLVADYEHSALGDRHYDFRYLPSFGPDLALLRDVIAAYEAATGSSLSLDRILAWYVRTALGDAMWRTERGVDLPDGRTPAEWVDEVVARVRRYGAAR